MPVPDEVHEALAVQAERAGQDVDVFVLARLAEMVRGPEPAERVASHEPRAVPV